jgi:hypothetical protein
MWVVYRTTERRIIGLTAHCDQDIDKETALAEVVEGTVRPGELSEYDAIQVTDGEKAHEYMEAFPDKLVLTGTARKPSLAIRDPEVFSLFITVDAPDKHPVDGIPEIPADGSSSALITIQKIDERFRPQRSVKDNEQLFFRTDHGAIRDVDGKEDINRIALNKGEVSIRLYSEKAKRVATLQIMSDSPDLRGAVIRIEFI